MMAQKHLHELLQEDQEPFLLKNYIEDRRCQLRTVNLQLKKRSRPHRNSNFPSNFCKKACFFSFNNSPDPRKSPLKSPVSKSPKSVFLHVPSRTSALLLEAAVRIQKQSKNRDQNRGLVGSLLKKLTLRKREICGDNVKVSVKDILRWDSSRRKSNGVDELISPCEIGFSCSCNASHRPSSAVWSESNEEKSFDFDFETSSSCQSEYLEEFSTCEKQFCESPFRFVLQKSPSPNCRTPEFSSPATSPRRHTNEDKENFAVESLKKLQQDEEDEEQCSPVSVLDPPFEDDDDNHYYELNDEEEEEEEGFDIENSFAIVQRAKQQLLHKLRRFERLAELDPVELEKIMTEQLQDGDEYESESDQEFIKSLDREKSFVKEVMFKSSFHHSRLVSDLIMEEEKKTEIFDTEVTMNRVCKRLELWKEVDLNTIDMMVHLDFRSEVDDEWKKNQVQGGEMAKEIERAIFGALIEELSD